MLTLDEHRKIADITAFVGLVGPCADDNEPPSSVPPLFERVGLPPAIDA